MYDDFDEETRRALFQACQETIRSGRDEITSVHIFLGILATDSGRKFFVDLNINTHRFETYLRMIVSPGKLVCSFTAPPLSKDMKIVLNHVHAKRGVQKIFVHDLIRGILEIDCTASLACKYFGIPVKK